MARKVKTPESEVFNKPDLKAPRFRLGCAYPSLVEFKNTFPQYKNLTKKQMDAVLFGFSEKILQGVINNRDGVDLPQRMGVLFIAAIKSRPGHGIVNYGQSAKMGKKVYSINLKTDGHTPKISFNNAETRYNYAFKDMWGFKACKHFRSGVSESFPLMYTIYHRDNKRGLIDFRENQATRSEQNKRREKKALETYNEFE